MFADLPEEVGNLIPFRTRGHLSDSRETAAALVLDPELHTHSVQFYEDETFLVRTLREFLTAGLKAGDRIVVIATKSHRDAFLAAIDQRRARDAIADGQLTLLDATETLAKFMVGDMPDPISSGTSYRVSFRRHKKAVRRPACAPTAKWSICSGGEFPGGESARRVVERSRRDPLVCAALRLRDGELLQGR